MTSVVKTRQSNLARSRFEHSRQLAAERELARAEEDYLRLRSAYHQLAKEDPEQVALAMIGADMDRAYAVLQRLSGLPQPFRHETARVVRGEARSTRDNS